MCLFILRFSSLRMLIEENFVRLRKYYFDGLFFNWDFPSQVLSEKADYEEYFGDKIRMTSIFDNFLKWSVS